LCTTLASQGGVADRLTSLLVICGSAVLWSSCYPVIRATGAEPPTAKEQAELWVDPGTDRDLFNGPGGAARAPDPSAVYTVVEKKVGGFSLGYTVTDPSEREWSVKLYPEAHPEVVASRIFWGVGYHQVPEYFLETWTGEGTGQPNPQTAARFREKKPDFYGIKEEGTWSYYHNPFVDSREMNGMLVLQAMLGNSDLKDDQNRLFKLDEPVDGASKWYVALDLGQSFGRTGIRNPPRDDPEVFDKTPFIKGVLHGVVRFEWRGRHSALVEHIKVADVHWICDRLSRFTDDQWRDAFRAGGYAQPIADRYIHRMKEKIAEGLALHE
jgi:hypothetical protein